MGQAIRNSPFAQITQGLPELLAHNQRALAAGTVGCLVTLVTAYFRGPYIALKFALGYAQWMQGGVLSNHPAQSPMMQHGAQPSIIHTVSSQAIQAGHHVLTKQQQKQLANYAATNHHVHPAPQCIGYGQTHPYSGEIINIIPNTYPLQALNNIDKRQLMLVPACHAGVQQGNMAQLAIHGSG